MALVRRIGILSLRYRYNGLESLSFARYASETKSKTKEDDVINNVSVPHLEVLGGSKDPTLSKDSAVSGFSKAFTKFASMVNQQHLNAQEEPNEPSFTKLLRNSNFIQLGDPQGKVLEGKIFQVVGDDLYVDFGGKFHCVIHRPSRNAQDYVRGAKVRLRMNALELSTRFLGATSEITLREADGVLLGSARISYRKGM